jgi:hypothetical protein
MIVPGTLRERLMEADDQAERRGQVWSTLRRIAAELDRLGIPYAVVGGIALQHHGLQRSTQDLDLLVDAGDLPRVHAGLIGRGYHKKSPDSRHLRDDVTRIRIEFLVSGEYPGDGRPKPVAFPDPRRVAERSPDGLWFVNLPALIEMKLASAKTAPQRIRDRADVLELIHLSGLPASFADRLDPYVQPDFRELAALPPPREDD